VTRWLVVLLLLAARAAAGAAGGDASADASAPGSKVFRAHCSACHQPGGQGVPGAYPPLKDAVGRYAQVPQGRAYLAHVVIFGMAGTIASAGHTYNGFMQPWPQLTDAQVADVLNYILLDLNAALLPKGFAPFTPDEVHALRAHHQTFDQVRGEREALLATLGVNPAAAGQEHP
jgi:mono/diheme cytochrome c family protein